MYMNSSSFFFSLWQEGRGEFKGINNIISFRRAAPVLRDHYNFITSSHSNIDDDGDGDDVSNEFSCVILEVTWDALTSSKQFNWETARCDTLGHDVFRITSLLHLRTIRWIRRWLHKILEIVVPERYMVAGEKKNLYMTSYLKISRSRVGTLGRVFRRFQRLERF